MPAHDVQAARKYWRLRGQGYSQTQAAQRAGISRSTAAVWEKNKRLAGDTEPLPKPKQRDAARAATRKKNFNTLVAEDLAALLPVPQAEGDAVSAEARAALDDFQTFRMRYFGRASVPWQVQAAKDVVELLQDKTQRDFAVLNVPPGSGKSTFLTDLCTWLICRNRGIRIVYASISERMAQQYTHRVRANLERRFLIRATDEDKDSGMAFDGTGVICEDYGIFRPENSDIWRREAFTVAQSTGESPDEKEPTMQAVGIKTQFIGTRADLVIGDDADSTAQNATLDMREARNRWWDDVVETRADSGGLVIQCQQRLGPGDLSAHCLAKKVAPIDEDEDELLDEDPDNVRPEDFKYRHIVYAAHDDTKCRGWFKGNPDHAKDSAPWNPDGTGGCLLDPKRLSARDLRGVMSNPNYGTVYQQKDMDERKSIMPAVYFQGGTTEEGFVLPGCYDKDRQILQVPARMEGFVSVLTADPSPTKMWAIQWWLYHPDTNTAYLMDLLRSRLPADQFLDYNTDTNKFTGILEDWWQRSKDMGLPITVAIVEGNAAQRFIFAYQHFRRFQAQRNLEVIAHQTNAVNKNSTEFGVQTLASWFKQGRLRLPYHSDHGPTRMATMKLVDECLRWPEGGTDDQVMAAWFLTYNSPRLFLPKSQGSEQQSSRPGYLRGRERGLRGWRDR